MSFSVSLPRQVLFSIIKTFLLQFFFLNLLMPLGVMSALRHDSIIDAGDPDYALVEGEAERVAKQAVIIIHMFNIVFFTSCPFLGSSIEKFTS